MIKRNNINKNVIKYVTGSRVYNLTNNTGTATYTSEIVFAGHYFHKTNKALTRIKTANLLSHQWSATIQTYNNKNYVDSIVMDSATYDIDFRLYNKPYANNSGKMFTADTIRADLETLKQCANTDINNQTPGKLVYRVTDHGSTYYYNDSYLTGYITGITINDQDSNGWWVDVTIHFLSIDGFWIQEINKTGAAGSATNGVNVGNNIAFENSCDFKITLYDVTRSTWSGYTLRAESYNKVDICSARCASDDDRVTIDTLKHKAYSDTYDNYIPYLSPKDDPFRMIQCAGARSLQLTTPYAYDLTIYNRKTQPLIKYTDI